MNKPEYLAPTTIEEAFEALKSNPEGAMIIAGGTDMVPRMRVGVFDPELLVDLRLLGLNEIKDAGDWISIGASATHTDILESDLLAEYYPALIEAARDVAGPPIRNRGTLGGNLVNASPAADLATPLIAYDALAVIAGQNGERDVPLSRFFTGPGKTVLEAGEILVEIKVPKAPAKTGAKFTKLGKRKAMAIAVVSAAVRISLDDDGVISQARIGLGSVAPVPLRVQKAEEVLEGQKPDEDLFVKAGQAASDECNPITDLRSTGEYRKKMVSVLVRRALAAAWTDLQAE